MKIAPKQTPPPNPMPASSCTQSAKPPRGTPPRLFVPHRFADLGRNYPAATSSGRSPIFVITHANTSSHAQLKCCRDPRHERVLSMGFLPNPGMSQSRMTVGLRRQL
jgi:hypothetical protein